jgi:hypothetical protein
MLFFSYVHVHICTVSHTAASLHFTQESITLKAKKIPQGIYNT